MKERKIERTQINVVRDEKEMLKSVSIKSRGSQEILGRLIVQTKNAGKI